MRRLLLIFLLSIAHVASAPARPGKTPPRPQPSKGTIQLEDASRLLFSGRADAALGTLRSAAPIGKRRAPGVGAFAAALGREVRRRPWLGASRPRDLRRAAGEVLARASEGGAIDPVALERRYGPEAVGFLDALRELSAAEPPPVSADKRIFLYEGGPALRRTLARVESGGGMAAFARMAARLGRGRPLRGFSLHAVQHLLGSTVTMLEALEGAGVARGAVIVSKPYSESARVFTELRRKGYSIRSSATAGAYDPRLVQVEIDRAVDDLRRDAAAAPRRRFLLIDDGGHLIKAVNERLPELASRIVAVEQTRRGVNLLRDLDLRFPVINVAESWAKLRYESPMIGRHLGNAILAKLASLRAQGLDPGRRVVQVGYGAVGRAEALTLRQAGLEVEVFDASPAARRRAKRDGMTVLPTLDAALTRGRVVLLSTGKPNVVGPHNVGLLPDGAVLFNTASIDTEIDPALKATFAMDTDRRIVDGRPRERLLGVDLELGDLADPAHMDRILALGGGRRGLLVHGGGVANFTGDVHGVPSRYIQLTRGLLFLGALQAAAARGAGLQDLDPQIQRRWVRAVRRDLARSGESLTDPRF